MNATNVVTKTLHAVGKTVNDLDGALLATRPGADGMSFLPFLNGERTPDLPRARGSLVGISSNNFTNENLIRAAVEGVSFGILGGLDRILDGRTPDVIYVIGGGSRSKEWRQLLADATGATIQMPLEEEAGSLGAAMQAMYAFHHAKGAPITLSEIADRCVVVSREDKQIPHANLREEYRRAMDRYQNALQELYLSKD
jgi:xylulokinase